ncbi:hypothetical protein (nucleomorph) [Guillardia theta]|uniref:Uncharacterized protein n=1 Tax=Guillardia theta TaxID=55529 RepID=Q98S03_GUITH|nr:hypothetical protein GTHECHR3131 [Guillardia theta]AAK39775.1 hypothetical protein [Guillardia theta]
MYINIKPTDIVRNIAKLRIRIIHRITDVFKFIIYFHLFGIICSFKILGKFILIYDKTYSYSTTKIEKIKFTRYCNMKNILSLEIYKNFCFFEAWINMIFKEDNYNQKKKILLVAINFFPKDYIINQICNVVLGIDYKNFIIMNFNRRLNLFLKYNFKNKFISLNWFFISHINFPRSLTKNTYLLNIKFLNKEILIMLSHKAKCLNIIFLNIKNFITNHSNFFYYNLLKLISYYLIDFFHIFKKYSYKLIFSKCIVFKNIFKFKQNIIFVKKLYCEEFLIKFFTIFKTRRRFEFQKHYYEIEWYLI